MGRVYKTCLDCHATAIDIHFSLQLYAKIGIRVSLVGMETWNRRDLIYVTSNSHTLLDDFVLHLWSRTERFDSAMLITLV